MRICLVSQEYPPETASGGIGTQTYLKAHGLVARGHEVSVLSASPTHADYESWDDGVRVVRIGGYYGRMPLNTEPTRWITYSAEVAAGLYTLRSRRLFDIVDFPEWGCEGCVYLLNRSEWDHTPAVIQLHGPLIMFAHIMDWPDRDSEFYRIATAMEGACLRLADAVYSSSACSSDWCCRQYGLIRERIPTLHAGVDIRVFRPRTEPEEGPPTIVFVGRIDAKKGIDVLVDSACVLARRRPSLRLRIIGAGDPEFMQELRAKAETEGFPHLLEFVGYVSTRELPEQLNKAHIFAAPSVYEGGPGFVYLEAMACGLPVIACRGSGSAEVISHGERGLLIPPADMDALTNALDLLLSRPDLRRSMGEHGRRFVEEQAESSVCLERLEAFYQTVIECGTWPGDAAGTKSKIPMGGNENDS